MRYINRVIVICVLVAATAACAKNQPAKIAKVVKVDEASMLRGQLLDMEGENLKREVDRATASFNMKVKTYQESLKTTYGVNFAAGDKIDSSGVVIWHEEKKTNTVDAGKK